MKSSALSKIYFIIPKFDNYLYYIYIHIYIYIYELHIHIYIYITYIYVYIYKERERERKRKRLLRDHFNKGMCKGSLFRFYTVLKE